MKNHFKKGVYSIICVVLILTSFSMIYLFTTWGDLSAEELFYSMRSPLVGTNPQMVMQGVVRFLFPAGIVSAVVGVILFKSKNIWITVVIFTTVFIFFIVSFITVDSKIGLIRYASAQFIPSDFIESNYVEPVVGENVVLPEEKRNLIYIYLESMESTYSDKESGGAYDDNYIPNLTRIAMENTSFSKKDSINGAVCLYDTTWTMAGMFAQTAALPLKIAIGDNEMWSVDAFFPNIVTLGDILEDAGYRNILMLGSDATFGGRRKYFTSHGNYEIKDYLYFQENGMLPPDYHVFWGMEDEKLFSFAKKELEELAKSEEPFNLTMLTVDTHFEDGYICELCDNKYGDDQYANVISCSDRQVADFLDWIKKQDFYENTTIVLAGDHITMDSDFCIGLDDDSRRVYTCYINPKQEMISDANRIYSTLDNMPTTLASLGAEIKGDQLGLGVNLFSNKKTIVEQYGVDKCNTEFERRSDFMDRMSEIDGTDITNDMISELQTNSIIKTKLISKDEYYVCFYPGSGIIRSNNSIFGNYSIRYGGRDDKKRNEVDLNINLEELANAGKDNKRYFFEGVIRFDESEPINIEVLIRSKQGKEIPILTMNSVIAPLNLEQYLDYISRLGDRYTLCIAACDEFTNGLSDKDIMVLNSMGLSTDKYGFRNSYYAIVSQGEVIEDIGQDRKEYRGKLPGTEHKLYILSEGYDVSGENSKCSIRIDDEEYAVNSIGLNIVVYDNETEEVVNSVSFNTYEQNQQLCYRNIQ